MCVLNVLHVCQCMCAWQASWSSIDLKLIISLGWLVSRSLGSPSLSPVLGLQAAQLSLAFHMGAGDSTWVFMAITGSQLLGFKEYFSGRV